MRGVIQDIHLLSLTDYLVCTFSSQVCRIAYEIMQQQHTDASSRFKSLDDIWYYGGQEEHQQEAILRHKPTHHGEVRPYQFSIVTIFYSFADKTFVFEVELKVGDVIGVAGNHWDGFNKGRNHR